MSQPAWLNKYLQIKPEVAQIFEDLDNFQQFCRDYGYAFDESHLYNERKPAYAEFTKMRKGREPWDQWRTPRRERKEFTPRPGYNNNNHRPHYSR